MPWGQLEAELPLLISVGNLHSLQAQAAAGAPPQTVYLPAPGTKISGRDIDPAGVGASLGQVP